MDEERKMKEKINNLIQFVHDAHEETRKTLSDKIIRGHLRVLSAEIEDGIAFFVSEIIPSEYKVLLDPSININGENNRPDLLLIDQNNNVKALMEIKSNMGWCRNSQSVADKIINKDKLFSAKSTLVCKFKEHDSIEVKYGNNVPLYLIALTSKNCPQKRHDDNKVITKEKGVRHYLLFKNWYHSLEELEIEKFANDLVNSI